MDGAGSQGQKPVGCDQGMVTSITDAAAQDRYRQVSRD
jgi:hypothetical protein